MSERGAPLSYEVWVLGHTVISPMLVSGGGRIEGWGL